MCWQTILNLFKKPSVIVTPPVDPPPVDPPPVNPPPDPPLALTHPEEPRNPSQTVATLNVADVLTQWFSEWNVPAEHWDYWGSQIDIQLYDVWPQSMLALGINPDTPACTWSSGGIRHLASLASWFNKGVVAHEQAHCSYALLTQTQKQEFAVIHAALKESNPLVKFLYSVNAYGLSNDVEGHAEMYRYLGDRMPAEIKRFYPRLF